MQMPGRADRCITAEYSSWNELDAMTQTSENISFDVLAGVIIGAHGVQGTVKVRLATKTALTLLSSASSVSRIPIDVLLRKKDDPPDSTGTPAVVFQVKPTAAGNNVYLVKLQGVRDRNAAEALMGSAIYAPTARRAPLQDDEFFVDDLIGLDVVGHNGATYGKITSVLAQPANDVYETDQGVLIPAVKEFVRRVDLASGKVIVFEAVGLRPEEAEEVAPEPNQAED
jgi:16S rRNA processing protein RimM